MEPTLHRILEFTLPCTPAGFGLILDANSNRIVETDPDGLAAQAGLRVGDIVMVVNGEGVTCALKSQHPSFLPHVACKASFHVTRDLDLSPE